MDTSVFRPTNRTNTKNSERRVNPFCSIYRQIALTRVKSIFLITSNPIFRMGVESYFIGSFKVYGKMEYCGQFEPLSNTVPINNKFQFFHFTCMDNNVVFLIGTLLS